MVRTWAGRLLLCGLLATTAAADGRQFVNTVHNLTATGPGKIKVTESRTISVRPSV